MIKMYETAIAKFFTPVGHVLGNDVGVAIYFEHLDKSNLEISKDFDCCQIGGTLNEKSLDLGSLYLYLKWRSLMS